MHTRIKRKKVILSYILTLLIQSGLENLSYTQIHILSVTHTHTHSSWHISKYEVSLGLQYKSFKSEPIVYLYLPDFSYCSRINCSKFQLLLLIISANFCNEVSCLMHCSRCWCKYGECFFINLTNCYTCLSLEFF